MSSEIGLLSERRSIDNVSTDRPDRVNCAEMAAKEIARITALPFRQIGNIANAIENAAGPSREVSVGYQQTSKANFIEKHESQLDQAKELARQERKAIFIPKNTLFNIPATVLVLKDGTVFIHKKFEPEAAEGSTKKAKTVTMIRPGRTMKSATRLRAHVTKPEILERLKNEIRVMKDLRGKAHHVKFFYAHTHWNKDGQLTMAIYVEKYDGDLRTILSNGVDLTAEQRIKIAESLIESLREMHQENIAHRDIKLENALWDSTREIAVLTDFDLAVSSLSNKRISVRGDDEWFSPEKGNAMLNKALWTPADELKADVWALGRLLGMVLLPESCPLFHNLIEDMMQYKPDERPNIETVSSRWKKIHSQLAAPVPVLSEPLMP